MSTNFYWRHNICECCGRYDELHICKSLVTFRGYFTDDWDDVKVAPSREPLIVSWLGWTEKLLSEGEVWNEYRDRIDTYEFINMVESTDLAARRRNYDWQVNHQGDICVTPLGVAPGCSWLDDMGFSFSEREFS